MIRIAATTLLVLALTSTAAKGAPTIGRSGELSPGQERIAAAINTQEELDRAPKPVQEKFTQVTEEVVDEGEGVETFASGEFSAAAVRCGYVYKYKAGKNAYGWVLYEAKLTVFNYCFDGKKITSEPWASHWWNTNWGYGWCGWTNQNSGWISKPTRWHAHARANFRSPNMPCTTWSNFEVPLSITVRGDGSWDTW